jgi:HipA-like C-terminal domain
MIQELHPPVAGETLTVRPIQINDLEMQRDFIRRLSPSAKRFRFFGGYWLLKFDGVTANKDKELEDPKGYSVVEYEYALMAAEAPIKMSECRLLEEGGRRHFMTRRCDRLGDGGKLHMQSLAALSHFDSNSAGTYSYEQALDVIKRLGLKIRPPRHPDVTQLGPGRRDLTITTSGPKWPQTRSSSKG